MSVLRYVKQNAFDNILFVCVDVNVNQVWKAYTIIDEVHNSAIARLNVVENIIKSA